MAVVQFNGRSSSAAKGGLVATLDIGSSKVSCLIAETMPGKGGGLEVKGAGHQLSRGVKAGSIVDVDEAERAIRLAVDAAERKAQRTVSEVHVSVSGGRPRSRHHAATIATQTGQVSPRDMDNVLNAALAEVDPGSRHILHIVPIHYHLDDARGVKTPLGMHGEKLGLELCVVTVESPHLKNMLLAIERAHLSCAGFVAAPYAAARSVLAEDEKKLGVTLIDMGGATTSFAVFSDGSLVHADMIPLGGQHITNDLAQALNTNIAHAERMKTLWGSALATQADDREMLAVPLLGERGVDTIQKVPKSMLCGIIRPRLEEIFELVRDKMAECRAGGRRVVLTGGASQLNGAREIASLWLERQVRVSLPQHIPGMPESTINGGFAVAAGMLSYALEPDVHYSLPREKAREIERAQHGYVRRVGRWIAESF